MVPENDHTQRNKKLPPPSFTPASGRPTRPARTPAIQVGEDVGSQASAAPQGQSLQPSPTPGSAVPASIPPRRTSTGKNAHTPQPPAQPAGVRPQRAPMPVQQQNFQAPPGAQRQPPPNGPGPAARPKKRKKKTGRVIALLLVVALIAWPLGLLVWANGKLDHIEALTGISATPGTTYVIAGSDSRADGPITENVEGARTDTIMLLHVPDSGPSALISLPRDIYVPIPGYNSNKINASYSIGGAPLLVETVEDLTGLTVDHYVEVGFAGVTGIVDALGGVELCYDRDVVDKPSKLDWKAGCHMADGDTALAFARMRKQDPLGDIGRAQRQRQVVSAVSSSLKSPAKLFNPLTQVSLANAGAGAVTVSAGSNILDLGQMALAFRNANSDKGVTGTPPIVSLNYRPGGVGSAVQLDDAATVQFFNDIAAGALKPGEYNGLD